MSTEVHGVYRSETSDDNQIQNSSKRKEKEYQCNDCIYKTKWRSCFIRHRRKHTNTKFKCDQCSTSFSTNYCLNRHKRIKHDGGIICDHCSKIFLSKDGLDMHMRTVRGEFLYKCDTCGKTFLNKTHYEGHMNSHREYKPFKCTKCTKKFTYQCSLQKHLEMCGKESLKFFCNICKMQFSSRDSLRAHNIGKHSDEVKKCDMCGKTYKWAASYYRHIKKHTSN